MLSGSRGWWIGCILAALAAASVPFLWRLEGAYFGALAAIGVAALAGLATLVRGLRLMKAENGLSRGKGLFGFVLLAAGVAFGVFGGPIAREAMFSLNYEKHLKLIALLLSQHRTTRRGDAPESGAAELAAKDVREGGFQGGSVDYPNGSLMFTFKTPAGQGHENVYFSLDQLQDSEARRLVKQDDRGHWYFAL